MIQYKNGGVFRIEKGKKKEFKRTVEGFCKE